MSLDDELDEIEDLEMLYGPGNKKRQSGNGKSGCCLFTLCCLPFHLFAFLLKSIAG